MNARERRLLVQGYTKAVLEAEVPISAYEKIFTNLILSMILGFVSFSMGIFLNPLFYVLFILFMSVGIFSAWKIQREQKKDTDLIKGFENNEPAR
jgi:hypothetical protein